MKPHKHEKFIKLYADGVRVERTWGIKVSWLTVEALSEFDARDQGTEFRIAPNQPADEEGWIPWFGGENPAVGTRVEYKLRDSQQSCEDFGSECLGWSHQNNDGEITHYRIVKEKIKEKVKKWRWMFFYPAPIQASSIYVSEPFTQAEAAKYFADSVRQRVVPEWKMEVECDE